MENRISAELALVKMCYISDRTFNGTIYTISDYRYPEYNGLKILKTLEYGQDIYSWINDIDNV